MLLFRLLVMVGRRKSLFHGNLGYFLSRIPIAALGIDCQQKQVSRND